MEALYKAADKFRHLNYVADIHYSEFKQSYYYSSSNGPIIMQAQTVLLCICLYSRYFLIYIIVILIMGIWVGKLIIWLVAKNLENIMVKASKFVCCFSTVLFVLILLMNSVGKYFQLVL